jgi:carbonic anhydrase
MRFSALATFVLAISAIAAAQTTNWNYQGKTGPLGWGKLDPAYEACSKGHEQSPISTRPSSLSSSTTSPAQ